MARRIGRTVAPWWLSLLLVILPAAAAALPTTKAPPGRPARPAVVQNYTPSPAVWLLEDADTRIYMIGTVHMLPPGSIEPVNRPRFP
jgi:hypothetical protein